MSDVGEKVEILKKHIQAYPDFPKPGVLFRDIFSIFQNPEISVMLRDIFIDFTKSIKPPIECVIGVDARGFLLGPLVALELKVPFVPIRKKGKLPGEVLSVSYTLEYGEDTLQIQAGSIKQGQRVLIVDDLLATGGSLGTACSLVEKSNGQVAACLVLMELTELNGREKVPADIISIIQY